MKCSNDILDRKYFKQFFFYFANSINEILINKLKSHVVKFKDYLFYDDDSEFLKRFYRKYEVGKKLQTIKNFYSKSYHKPYPNLFLVKSHSIMIKYFSRRIKMFYREIENNKKSKQNEMKQHFNQKRSSFSQILKNLEHSLYQTQLSFIH